VWAGKFAGDLGDHLSEHLTYAIADVGVESGVRGEPGADIRLDRVGGGAGVVSFVVEVGDGSSEPGAGQGGVGAEAALLREPGLGEQVEALVKAVLGVSIEVGRAVGGGPLGPASLRPVFAAAPGGGATLLAALVGVADHSGEVAVAEAHATAAGVWAEPSLGVFEVVERVALESADEGLGGTRHGVLGVDGFEEEAPRAFLGARVVALLLDDGAEEGGVLAGEGMGEVPTAGGVHAEEDGDEERAEGTGEVGAPERGERLGHTV